MVTMGGSRSWMQRGTLYIRSLVSGEIRFMASAIAELIIDDMPMFRNRVLPGDF